MHFKADVTLYTVILKEDLENQKIISTTNLRYSAIFLKNRFQIFLEAQLVQC